MGWGGGEDKHGSVAARREGGDPLAEPAGDSHHVIRPALSRPPGVGYAAHAVLLCMHHKRARGAHETAHTAHALVAFRAKRIFPLEVSVMVGRADHCEWRRPVEASLGGRPGAGRTTARMRTQIAPHAALSERNGAILCNRAA